MKWNVRSSLKPASPQELLDIVLANRDISDTQHFLHPKNPLELTLTDVGIDPKEIKKALKRLAIAKEKQEKIIVFGDYDCDGICATVVMWETLHELGHSVFPFIPHREKHGYGLSQKALDEILAQGKPAIIISVDNGIVAHDQWQRLKDKGVYTILTDHHEPDGKKLVASAVIHTTQLCGTTVAWMLARELAKEKAEQLLDLCALATIADQVPLTGSNRSFASFGLTQLNKTTRLGLKLLIEAAGLEMGKISTYGVSFGIVPRINAMGRLGDALDALRALCTHNETRARTLVTSLHTTNVERQDLTQQYIDTARLLAHEWEHEHIIVVAHESFHEGVIGLIASKLTEEFHKPSIVISIGKGSSKGSSRSVAGVHITNLLRHVKEDLMEVGGHPMAAGLRIETEKIGIFKGHIQALARETITLELLAPHIDVDCELVPSLFTLDTVFALKSMEPFGSGNREPLFLITGCHVDDVRSMGKEGKHARLKLTLDEESRSIEAIAFGMGNRDISLDSVIDCVGMLQINTWKGIDRVQFVTKDLLEIQS